MMKKGLLLLIAVMSLASVNAKNFHKLNTKIGVTNSYSDAVTFIERGIEFHIFFNGEFDFNTQPRTIGYNNSYRGGVHIEKDYNGRVRSVGNVFVNYDYRGNVTRIGSVYMKYRFGQLTRVGYLTINYDRFGDPCFRGSIKRSNRYNDYYSNTYYGATNNTCIFNAYDYNDAYFYRNDFKRNYKRYREDNNYYYYKALPNTRTGERGEFIKRSKHKRANVNNRDYNRYVNKNHNTKKRIIPSNRKRNNPPTRTRR